MTELSKGDKVRVISEHTLNGVGYGEVEVGDTVMVVGATGMCDVPKYHVRRADGGISVIDATCLELVVEYTFDPGGEKIAFGDVKVGDTVAALTYSQWRVAEVDAVRGNLLGDAASERIAYGDSDTEEMGDAPYARGFRRAKAKTENSTWTITTRQEMSGNFFVVFATLVWAILGMTQD